MRDNRVFVLLSIEIQINYDQRIEDKMVYELKNALILDTITLLHLA